MKTKGRPITPVKVQRARFSQVVWMYVPDADTFYAFAKASGNTTFTLAEATGKSRQLISAIARGERNCDPELAHKILAAMDLEAKHLTKIFAVGTTRIHSKRSTKPRQVRRKPPASEAA